MNKSDKFISCRLEFELEAVCCIFLSGQSFLPEALEFTEKIIKISVLRVNLFIQQLNKVGRYKYNSQRHNQVKIDEDDILKIPLMYSY